MPTLPALLRRTARSSYLRMTLLTATAVTAAYTFGLLFPAANPQIAAITALVTVRPTFHESVREGLRQVLGVVLAGLVALLMLKTFGFSVLVLAVSIIASYIAARLLRLGEEGAGAIGVSVILVVGPTFTADLVETRFLGVGVGALFALLASLHTKPGTPHQRALDAVTRQADRIAALLTEMADTLAHRDGRLDPGAAARWLDTAIDIQNRVVGIRAAAQDAVTGAAWSPLIARADAEAVLAQVRITQATVTTLLNICRDLQAAADAPALPGELAGSLSQVLRATADVVAEQAWTARVTPSEPLPETAELVVAVTETRDEAVDVVRALDDTQPLLLGGSLLRDTEKITDLLSGR